MIHSTGLEHQSENKQPPSSLMAKNQDQDLILMRSKIAHMSNVPPWKIILFIINQKDQLHACQKPKSLKALFREKKHHAEDNVSDPHHAVPQTLPTNNTHETIPGKTVGRKRTYDPLSQYDQNRKRMKPHIDL